MDSDIRHLSVSQVSGLTIYNVDAQMRSQSAGAMLMDELARIAKVNDCSHLAWNADARNTRGISFYHRLGAEIIEQHGNRCFFKWIP